MIGKPTTHRRSQTGRGAPWVVAAIPMLIGSMVFDGNGASIGIGVLFLILGITGPRKHESSVLCTGFGPLLHSILRTTLWVNSDNLRSRKFWAWSRNSDAVSS